MEQVEKFVLEFFENLKCKIVREDFFIIVSHVPRSFEDLYSKNSPYRFSFEKEIEGCEYILKGSHLLNVINKYLEGAGKTTLLKIDFELDADAEIGRMISMKNCEIDGITRSHKDNFFSRFTFVTTFRYLNESAKVVNEIYVHEGEIVEGDLSGYKVIEGDKAEVDLDYLEKDYIESREHLKNLLKMKTSEIGELLGERLSLEVKRVSEHYDNLIGELGGDLNEKLSKINELEEELKFAEIEKKEEIISKLDRLRKSLVKVGDSEAKNRILREKEFTLRDVQQKYSLNIDNKLVNTTVIYYPVFLFNLYLKGDKSRRYVEMSYDPLKKSLNKLTCENCEIKIRDVNLCSGGHITCESCLAHCGECGGQFCLKCLKKSCSSCGRVLCKNCSKMCLACGKNVCATHLRTDVVSGDERCVSCLRACLRCHGLSAQKYFGEAMDGSKICQKCLGEENRNKVMKRVFEED